MVERVAQLVVGDQTAAVNVSKTKAFVEPHQMRRGVDMNAKTGRFEDRAHERDGRSLAVGAGDMDHRRHLAFGMIEARENAMHAIEREIDELGMQPRHTCQDIAVGRRFAAGSVTLRALSPPAHPIAA